VKEKTHVKNKQKKNTRRKRRISKKKKRKKKTCGEKGYLETGVCSDHKKDDKWKTYKNT
jgi:hypothetical protein